MRNLKKLGSVLILFISLSGCNNANSIDRSIDKLETSITLLGASTTQLLVDTELLKQRVERLTKKTGS